MLNYAGVDLFDSTATLSLYSLYRNVHVFETVVTFDGALPAKLMRRGLVTWFYGYAIISSWSLTWSIGF